MAEELDLLADPRQWSANVDRGGTTMAIDSTADARLAVSITTDGVEEDYPKLRLAWKEPQDWSRFTRLQTRLKVSSEDPSVREKRIAFVFYDDKTLREDLEGRPWKQQGIDHTVPVGRWVDLRDWLIGIKRTAIRQLDLYIYEIPPQAPHSYRWEFAELSLVGMGEKAVMFDTEIYDRGEMSGKPGPVAAKVSSADGLEVVLGSGGGVGRVLLDGRTVGQAGEEPTGLLVRDATLDAPPVVVGGKVEQVDKDVRQTATVESLGLAAEATWRGGGQYIEVAGRVRDLRGEDRAVTVYLALPVAGDDWLWWDSMAIARTKEDTEAELAYYEIGMGYGLNGAHSKYPLGAVTRSKQTGLTLAVRMDEPVVHRVAYNPELQLFYLALDFGLVPEKTVDGRSLAEAPFRVLLYRHDPAWGFRSALQRYYTFFPEFFTKRVAQGGGWFVWGEMQKTEGALDAGFGFHWGPSRPEAVKWDNAHGVLALQYIEPEFFQQTMGDYEEAPPLEDALDRLHKLAAGDANEMAKFEKLSYSRSYTPGLWVREHSLREAIQTVAKAAEVSVNYNNVGEPYASIGQYPWMGESKWGVIFPCNLDPDIPEGKGPFCSKVFLDTGLREMEAAGAHYDGIGLDSLGGYGQLSRANYRREHFHYAHLPLSFGATDRKPVQVAAFATVEWLQELARDMHGRGLVLMTNCSWGVTPGWLTFGAPYLDIFGAEATQFADPDFIRAIAYRKPCTDLPYKPRPESEVAWHLLHGIFPGHGNEIAVMSKYAGMLRELEAAGWEPITHARVQPEALRIERFGSGDKVYLIVHNPGAEPVDARISVDVRSLGMAGFAAELGLGGGTVQAKDGILPVRVEAQGTTVLVLQKR